MPDNYDMNDLEELDYEDDLSVEGDNEDVGDIQILGESQDLSVGEKGIQPGTSSQMITQLANEKDEEKLTNNLVIQKVMLKFFKDQMKDMEENKGECVTYLQKEIRNQSETQWRVDSQRNVVKSPLDTTIYAPALQKKLTPTNDKEKRKR